MITKTKRLYALLALALLLLNLIACKRVDSESTPAAQSTPVCEWVVKWDGYVPNTSLEDPNAGSNYLLEYVCK